MSTTVLKLSELEPLQPLGTVIDGVPVCLVRIGDDVKAVHDVCSHQEYAMSEGMVFADGRGGHGIECDLHGSTFDLTTGEPEAFPATTPIPTYAVAVDGGEIRVDVSVATNGAAVPQH